ncbi:MAG: hypothetical protein NXI32_26975 [bacterium]|nr:hypothetical protein [bacterium]
MTTTTALPPKLDTQCAKPRSEVLRNALRDAFAKLPRKDLDLLESRVDRFECSVTSEGYAPKGFLEGRLVAAHGQRVIFADFLKTQDPRNREQLEQEVQEAINAVMQAARESLAQDREKEKRIAEATRRAIEEENRAREEWLENDALHLVRELTKRVEALEAKFSN